MEARRIARGLGFASAVAVLCALPATAASQGPAPSAAFPSNSVAMVLAAAPAPLTSAAASPMTRDLVTWPATWAPRSVLRVWFHEVGEDYQDMVWEAFSAWSEARVPVTVVPARSISEANVLVMERTHPLDRSTRLGQTTIRGGSGTIENAVVRLSRIDRYGMPIPRGLRSRTALHEVGHVLGLGHAPGDRIMHEVTRSDHVTLWDLADLGRLYADVTTPASP